MYFELRKNIYILFYAFQFLHPFVFVFSSLFAHKHTYKRLLLCFVLLFCCCFLFCFVDHSKNFGFVLELKTFSNLECKQYLVDYTRNAPTALQWFNDSTQSGMTFPQTSNRRMNVRKTSRKYNCSITNKTAPKITLITS